MNNKIVYDYNSQGDSLFIYCVEDYEYEVSLELDNGVILDIDKEGKPVAFEFLNASKYSIWIKVISKIYLKLLFSQISPKKQLI